MLFFNGLFGCGVVLLFVGVGWGFVGWFDACYPNLRSYRHRA